MITQKTRYEAELEDLFWKWAKAAPQEYEALEAFFTNHPDVDLPLPTLYLLKAAFKNHTLSTVKKKLKQIRATAAANTTNTETLKDLGLDPQPQSNLPPTAAEIRAFIHDFEPLFHQMEADEPSRQEFCRKTRDAAAWLNWDYYRGPKWTDPDGDKRFLNEMSVMPDYMMVEGQRTKLKIIGQEFFKWLRRLDKTTSGASNGSAAKA